MSDTIDETRPKARWVPPLGDLGAVVDRRIGPLQTGYLRDVSGPTATLARLRHGVGRVPGSLPELWELTIEGLPGRADGDVPTPEEWAAHTALTLYAMHQQSRDKAMHVRGRGFGQAVRRLAVGNRERAVRRRFEAVGTAITFAEAAHHLRGLITQLRPEKIPLDYGQLADDLLQFQVRRRGGPDAVRRRWARQYYQIDSQQNEPGAAGDQEDPK